MAHACFAARASARPTRRRRSPRASLGWRRGWHRLRVDGLRWGWLRDGGGDGGGGGRRARRPRAAGVGGRGRRRQGERGRVGATLSPGGRRDWRRRWRRAATAAATCGAVDEPPCTPSPPAPSRRRRCRCRRLAGWGGVSRARLPSKARGSAPAPRPPARARSCDRGVTFPDEVRYGPAGRDFLDEHHTYPTLDARPSSARNREARFDRTYRLPFDPNCGARRTDACDPPPHHCRLAPRRLRHAPAARAPIAAPTAPSTTLRRSSHLRPSSTVISLARHPEAPPPPAPPTILVGVACRPSPRARALFFDLEIDLYAATRRAAPRRAAHDDEDEEGGERRRST